MHKWIVGGLLLLPFVATAVTLAMYLGGWDCRRSSKVFVGLQLAAAGLCLFLVPWHHPAADMAQLSFAWSQYLQVTLSLGSDPLVQAALFSILLPLVGAVLIARHSDDFSEPQHISLHLFSLGLTGALLAANLLTFSFFLGFMTLASALLLSGDLNLSKGDAVARLLVAETGSLLLLGVGVVALQHQDSAALGSWLYVNIGERLVDTRALLFFLISLGFLLRSWIFPFSFYRFPLAGAHCKGLVPILFLSGFLGAYGMLRFMPALFAQEWLLHGKGIAFLAVITCVFGAFRLMYKSSAVDIAVGTLSIYQALVIAGLATANANGLTGAWVLFFFSGISLALLSYFLIVGNGALSANKALGFSALALLQRSGGVIANLVAAGTPVSVGFVGIALVLWGLAPWSTPSFVAALVCVAAVWFALFRYVSANAVDLSRRTHWQFAWSVGLIVLAFSSFIFSHWLIQAMRPTIELALRQLGGQA